MAEENEDKTPKKKTTNAPSTIKVELLQNQRVNISFHVDEYNMDCLILGNSGDVGEIPGGPKNEAAVQPFLDRGLVRIVN